MAPCDAQALIAKLRARIERLQEQSYVQRDAIIAAHKELERLSAENAGLREDAARLDWLSENGARIGLKDPVVYYHELRSAIDAARGGK